MLSTSSRFHPKIGVIQRTSLSHSRLKSRSIGARFNTMIGFLSREGLAEFGELLEDVAKPEDLRCYKAIVFNKATSAQSLQLMQSAAAMGVRTLYDLDDWIFDLPRYSVTKLRDDHIAIITEMLRRADVVSVSCIRLVEKLRFLRPDAVVIATGFDHTGVPENPSAFAEHARPRILFSNTDGVKLVAFRKQFFNELSTFLKNNPEVEFHFRGDTFPELGLLPRVTAIPFTPNHEYKQSLLESQYWFAITPLGGKEDSDTLEFNSCKSPVKYIDFGSLGIPGLFSNTPVYTDVVTDGVTGLLVDNEPGCWLGGMERMLRDSELRSAIRINAIRDCRARFGIRNPALVFLEHAAGLWDISNQDQRARHPVGDYPVRDLA